MSSYTAKKDARNVFKDEFQNIVDPKAANVTKVYPFYKSDYLGYHVDRDLLYQCIKEVSNAIAAYQSKTEVKESQYLKIPADADRVIPTKLRPFPAFQLDEFCEFITLDPASPWTDIEFLRILGFILLWEGTIWWDSYFVKPSIVAYRAFQRIYLQNRKTNSIVIQFEEIDSKSLDINHLYTYNLFYSRPGLNGLCVQFMPAYNPKESPFDSSIKIKPDQAKAKLDQAIENTDRMEKSTFRKSLVYLCVCYRFFEELRVKRGMRCISTACDTLMPLNEKCDKTMMRFIAFMYRKHTLEAVDRWNSSGSRSKDLRAFAKARMTPFEFQNVYTYVFFKPFISILLDPLPTALIFDTYGSGIYSDSDFLSEIANCRLKDSSADTWNFLNDFVRALRTGAKGRCYVVCKQDREEFYKSFVRGKEETCEMVFFRDFEIRLRVSFDQPIGEDLLYEEVINVDDFRNELERIVPIVRRLHQEGIQIK